MNKSTKIILLFFTILIPVFFLLYINGFYYQLFYGNFHQSFFSRDEIFNGLRVYGLKYVTDSIHESDHFINLSWLIFVIYFGVILFIYTQDLMRSNLKKDDKVSWFSLFVWSFGIGMLIYFYHKIWKGNPDFLEIKALIKTKTFLSEEY
jgi:hypothetical protein